MSCARTEREQSVRVSGRASGDGNLRVYKNEDALPMGFLVNLDDP